MDFNSFQKEDLWQEVLSQRTAARESRWRFVLPWCWTAQFADNRSDAAFAAGCWRAVKPCHRAHTPLCHLQHLLRLLAGDASGTITVLRLSAPGVPVSCPCNMPTCHSLLPNSFSPLLSHTHTDMKIHNKVHSSSFSSFSQIQNNALSVECHKPQIQFE